MADFDKAIPPGGEGAIELRVKTKGYQGQIHKSARVYHNDRKRGVIVLRITALVKVPIYLSSRYVYLRGEEDKSVTREVEVRGELDRPLKLTPIQFSLGNKVSYIIEEIEKDRKFRIRFKSIPGPPETYTGFLKLKTNYPERPEITVRIRGRFTGKS